MRAAQSDCNFNGIPDSVDACVAIVVTFGSSSFGFSVSFGDTTRSGSSVGAAPAGLPSWVKPP